MQYFYTIADLDWGKNFLPNHTWRIIRIKLEKNHGRYLLGYNEPDHEDQSGMPPKVAAEAWMELQESIKM